MFYDRELWKREMEPFGATATWLFFEATTFIDPPPTDRNRYRYRTFVPAEPAEEPAESTATADPDTPIAAPETAPAIEAADF
jgi:hypothetical protein